VTDKLKKILLGVAALAALALGGSALAGATSGGSDTAAQSTEAPENDAADTDNVQDENGKDDASEKKDGESEKAITGATATRAKDAAEAETGGKAGDVEPDTEKGSTYGVEVTKTDGTKVDVRLDDQFKVVSVDSNEEDQGDNQDGENKDEQDGETDDDGPAATSAPAQ
jgi:uncharacterized membrane protein YkoI